MNGRFGRFGEHEFQPITLQEFSEITVSGVDPYFYDQKNLLIAKDMGTYSTLKTPNIHFTYRTYHVFLSFDTTLNQSGH